MTFSRHLLWRNEDERTVDLCPSYLVDQTVFFGQDAGHKYTCGNLSWLSIVAVDLVPRVLEVSCPLPSEMYTRVSFAQRRTHLRYQPVLSV